MSKSYRSLMMASIHETAKGLHAAGVMDRQAMRKLDMTCLTSDKIRVLREYEGAGTNDAGKS